MRNCSLDPQLPPSRRGAGLLIRLTMVTNLVATAVLEVREIIPSGQPGCQAQVEERIRLPTTQCMMILVIGSQGSHTIFLVAMVPKM